MHTLQSSSTELQAPKKSRSQKRIFTVLVYKAAERVPNAAFVSVFVKLHFNLDMRRALGEDGCTNDHQAYPAGKEG